MKQINTPQYIHDLLYLLRTEYSGVKYYVHETEEYSTEDIFNIDGYVIMVDRIEEDLSQDDIYKLFNEIKDLHNNMKQQMKELGW